MIKITPLKHIVLKHNENNLYEFDDQGKILVVLIMETEHTRLQVHLIDTPQEGSIITEVDNSFYFYTLVVRNLDQNTFIFHLSRIDEDTDHEQNQQNDIQVHLFYTFNLTNKKIKLLYQSRFQSIVAFERPRIYELDQEGNLKITDITNLQTPKEFNFSQVTDFGFDWSKGLRPIFYLVISQQLYCIHEFLDQTEEYFKEFSLFTLDFYRKGKFHRKFKITVSDHDDKDSTIYQYQKRIIVYHNKILSLRSRIKILRTIYSTINYQIENTAFVLQYNNNIYKMTNGKIIYRFGKCLYTNHIKDLFVRVLEDYLDVFKISTE